MLMQLWVAPFPTNHALDIVYDRTSVFKRLLARLLPNSNFTASVKGDVRRSSLPLLLQALWIFQDLDCFLRGPKTDAGVGRAEIDSDPRLVVWECLHHYSDSLQKLIKLHN